MRGNARDIIRQAQLEGLLCAARAAEEDRPEAHGPERPVRLFVSGPYALFRRTLVYARALGRLVPRLRWCTEFTLQAECVLEDGAEPRVLSVGTGAPIFPAAEPKRFDSAIERRFARAFSKAAPAWDLVREPAPIPAGDRLLFPDFELRHRSGAPRYYLEIVGFWTPEYLAEKLEGLRRASIANLILCVDEARGVGSGALPPGAQVVPFRRSVDVDRVLSILAR
jgi:hypothetical protein